MLEQSPATKPFTIRLPNDLRAALERKAKATRRSMTSLVLEGVEQVVEAEPHSLDAQSTFLDRVRKVAGAGRVGEGLDKDGMAERMRLIRGDD